MNLYEYVTNNPTMFADYWGLEAGKNQYPETFWSRFAYGKYFFTPGVDQYFDETSIRLRTMPGAAKEAFTKDAILIIDVCCNPKQVCDKASEIKNSISEKVEEIANDPDPLKAAYDTGKSCCSKIAVSIKDGVVESVNNITSDDPVISGEALGKGFYQGAKGAVIAKGCEKAFDAITSAFKKGTVASDIVYATDKTGELKNGSFSISDWSGYPEGMPKPDGPFRLIDGSEYAEARKAANKANCAIHKADLSLAGKQIHEIKPVKFDGSPTSPANKIPLTPPQHTALTNWWNGLARKIKYW